MGRWNDAKLVLTAIALGQLAIAACQRTAQPEWHEEAGYRWRELSVPRRGRDGFRMLQASQTGITFVNSVTEEQVLENEHILNGSGVALGDVDGDGLVDIYFSRLDGPNVLYKNLGGWRFQDITEAASVTAPNRFSTGAVAADVDGDHDLDLLVTSIGGPHALFLNDGSGVFEDGTQRSGLAAGSYGTTMTLADVDGDADLDLYVANNKVRPIRDMLPPPAIAFDRVVQEINGRHSVRPEFREHYGVTRHGNVLMRFEYAEPDKFYLNDGTGRFEDVPFTSGWFLDTHGQPLAEAPRDWGLAARFHDMDGDGDPDLYVCNDFESPDHIWINDGTGRFRMIDAVAVRTTSNANMAIDFADVDRDGDVDFFAVDMLDLNSGKQKTQSPARVEILPPIGAIEDRQQLPRNTFFVNRGDGTFAETARFAGVEASGWSWSALFLDVDLDGYEDILIGTGHERDFLDLDTKERLQSFPASLDWRRRRFLYPKLHLPNVAYRNNGDLTFDEVGEAWGFAAGRDVTHGTAAADLDGDGDLDVVTNRLGYPAGVYRNESTRPRIAVRLSGRAPNTQGTGAKIVVRGGPVPEQSKEVTLGGMYVSSSDPLYTFAVGDADELSIRVEWRSGAVSIVEGARPNRLYDIAESGAAPPTSTAVDSVAAPYFRDVTHELAHVHTETAYDDFRRQPLLFHRLSHAGPGVTWHDIDRDGDEDLLITSGRGGKLAVYRNDGGRLTTLTVGMDATPLDQTTVLAIPHSDGATSLLVGQMNYEAESPAAAVAAPSVLRLNLGSASNWGAIAPTVSPAVPGTMSSTGPLALADTDGDGDLDLFVGGRALPARYPTPPSSRLFLNDDNRFTLDATNLSLLSDVGLVSSAVFSDVDGDGDPDLLLALEWGSVKLYLNERGTFSDASKEWRLAELHSLWNGLATGDLNEDGLLDIVATSWGRNTRFAASEEYPLLVYYTDFDRSGTMDVVTARYNLRIGDIAPLRGRTRLAMGIPFLRRRFATHAAFADATVRDVLGPALAGARSLDATTLDHTLFLNRGDHFEAMALPDEAQLAPAFSAAVADFDGDGHEDVFLAQNFYPTENETQRYDAGRGLWLRGDGTGTLEPVPGAVSGIRVYGDQRGAALADFDADGRVDLVISQNANATKLYRNERAQRGLRVRLVGPPGNPDAVGATVRLVYGARQGPAREIQAGSGYWSQNGPVQVLGLDGEATAVWVRWPGGQETTEDIPPNATEIVVQMLGNER